MHENSRLMFEKHAARYFRDGARVLEIGPDSLPSTYAKVVGQNHWDTLDIKERGCTYVGEEYKFPIATETYDIVFSANVIEHVREVWTWMRELARVTKPGGRVITICPVSWHYHEQPVDCWRIYPDGMRALYRSAGIDVELCVRDMLELPGHPDAIPGRSLVYVKEEPLWKAYAANLKAGSGPVEAAWDTIAVGVVK